MKTIAYLCMILCTPQIALATDFTDVQFVRNHDGDTITVNLPGVPDFFGKNVDVRMHGMETEFGGVT